MSKQVNGNNFLIFFTVFAIKNTLLSNEHLHMLLDHPVASSLTGSRGKNKFYKKRDELGSIGEKNNLCPLF